MAVGAISNAASCPVHRDRLDTAQPTSARLSLTDLAQPCGWPTGLELEATRSAPSVTSLMPIQHHSRGTSYIVDIESLSRDEYLNYFGDDDCSGAGETGYVLS